MSATRLSAPILRRRIVSRSIPSSISYRQQFHHAASCVLPLLQVRRQLADTHGTLRRSVQKGFRPFHHVTIQDAIEKHSLAEAGRAQPVPNGLPVAQAVNRERKAEAARGRGQHGAEGDTVPEKPGRGGEGPGGFERRNEKLLNEQHELRKRLNRLRRQPDSISNSLECSTIENNVKALDGKLRELRDEERKGSEEEKPGTHASESASDVFGIICKVVVFGMFLKWLYTAISAPKEGDRVGAVKKKATDSLAEWERVKIDQTDASWPNGAFELRLKREAMQNRAYDLIRELRDKLVDTDCEAMKNIESVRKEMANQERGQQQKIDEKDRTIKTLTQQLRGYYAKHHEARRVESQLRSAIKRDGLHGKPEEQRKAYIDALSFVGPIAKRPPLILDTQTDQEYSKSQIYAAMDQQRTIISAKDDEVKELRKKLDIQDAELAEKTRILEESIAGHDSPDEQWKAYFKALKSLGLAEKEEPPNEAAGKTQPAGVKVTEESSLMNRAAVEDPLLVGSSMRREQPTPAKQSGPAESTPTGQSITQEHSKPPAQPRNLRTKGWFWTGEHRRQDVQVLNAEQ